MSGTPRDELEAEFDAVAYALRGALDHAEREVQRLRAAEVDLSGRSEFGPLAARLYWAQVDLMNARATLPFLEIRR